MPDSGVLRIQRMITELFQFLIVHQFCHVIKIQDLNLLDFVAGAEPVKAMLDGNMPFDGRQMGYSTHVHTFLHAGRGQLGPAGLPAGHHIGMISENGNRVNAQ